MTMHVGYWYGSAAITDGNLVNSSNLQTHDVPPPGSTDDQVLQSPCNASVPR